MKAALRTAAFFALACAVALLVLEGVARIGEWISPTRAVDYGQGFTPDSRLFVADAYDDSMVVTHPTKTRAFVTQRWHVKKGDKTLRIAVLGGSSVHYLDEKIRDMSRSLQERLAPRYSDVEIINAGGFSYGSQRLIPILAELLQMGTDLIVIYSAHNEFEEIEQLDLAGLESLPFQRTLGRLALYRRIQEWLVNWRVQSLRNEHNDRLLEKPVPDHARAWEHEFSESDRAARMASFEANLTTMVRMCRERSVPLLMGTVPSNLIKPYLPKRAWERYQIVWRRFEEERFVEGYALGRKILAESTGRHQSSDQENGIIRRLAAALDVTLVDVEKAIEAAEPHGVPGEQLFDDHCHLNDAGMSVWRVKMEAQIVGLLSHE